MGERAAWKYRLIGTPLQEPAVWLRDALDWRRITEPQFKRLRGEDRRIRKIMERVIRPGSNCIDVGCHYGSMLARMRRLAPHGHHIAIEAVPAKAQFLRDKFPDVDVRELAVSDEEGTATFWVNTTRSGFSGLQQGGDGDFDEVQVTTRRLDDIVVDDRSYDFLKIDVEGAELLVLRGAPRLLDRHRPDVVFECGPNGPAAFGFTSADLFEAFADHGYSIYTTHGWLDGAPPLDEKTFLRGLEYPYEAFNWFATTRG